MRNTKRSTVTVIRYFKPVIGACMLISGIFTRAQQPLNFGFEKVSVEGVRRPWGWDNDLYAAGMQSGLDSSVVHQGKYSLSMKGAEGTDNGQMQSVVYYLEPFSLTNKMIRIEGWVKTKSLAGNIIIKVEQNRDTAGGVITMTDSLQPTTDRSNEWKKFSFSSRVYRDLNWIRIVVCQTGAGTAWIDDLALYVNKKKMQVLKVAAPFSNQQLQWLNKASSPIRGVDATVHGKLPDYNDLDVFKRITGDARIIALGEATHGTSEFFRMKHRVLEYAVREMGVRIFAIEDHQLVVQKVNDYVLNGVGNARSSMYGMFGVWDNQEVYDMIKWIRSYNIDHPYDKVEFAGFDMQGLSQPLDSLYSFLEMKDPLMFETVKQLLAGLKKNLATVYSASDSVKHVWKDDTKKVLELLLVKKDLWLASSHSRQDSLAIEWGIQYARLVKQFGQELIDPMALYRDEAMAENVSWILSMHPKGTKMLIWAHDVHISRGEHADNEFNYHRGVSMGSWLAKKYGAQYKAYGLSTYTGYYRAFPSYSDYSKWISCPVFPGPVGSLDEALHQLALKRKTTALLLDLKNSKEQPWLSAPLPVRFANHVSFEYAYWTRFSLPYQFDGIFFIDTTNAAKAYKTE